MVWWNKRKIEIHALLERPRPGSSVGGPRLPQQLADPCLQFLLLLLCFDPPLAAASKSYLQPFNYAMLSLRFCLLPSPDSCVSLFVLENKKLKVSFFFFLRPTGFRGFWSSHRRKFLVSLGVVGGGYLVYKLYASYTRRLSDLEQQLEGARQVDELIKNQYINLFFFFLFSLWISTISAWLINFVIVGAQIESAF